MISKLSREAKSQIAARMFHTAPGMVEN